MSQNKKPPTVSIITRCKGRLNHLKQTLPFMLMQDYFQTEIIVVNYNSPDGLHEWLMEEYGNQYKLNRLIEVFVPDTLYFDHSHSRNVGLKAALGDWVLYLDADCKASNELVRYLLFRIAQDKMFAMIGYPTPPDTSGTLFAKRQDLLDLGGFQESFFGWGYEDGDMRDRLFLHGREMFCFNPRFIEPIPHADVERFKYFKPPFNKQTETSWKNDIKIENCNLSIKYIQTNGVVANKGKPWGEGGHILNQGERYITKSSENLAETLKQVYAGTKGVYMIHWGPNNEALNEKQLIEAGCPPGYIAQAKKKRAEGFKHKMKLEDLKKHIHVTPEKVTVGDPEDYTHRPKVGKKQGPQDLVVEVDEEDENA